MSLRIKILSGFLILAVMLFVAGLVSIFELSSIGTSVQKLLDDNYKSISAAKTMVEALEREDSAILLLLSGKWEEGRSTIETADRLFNDGFEIARNNVTISGEKEYIDKIELNYKAYKNLWIKPIVGTQHERNLSWYFQNVHKTFQDVKESVEKLMALNSRTMYQTASDLENRAHRAIMPFIVAMLSALIFVIIFNFFVNYYMVSPLINLTKGIRSFIATGKPLDVKIETKDELLDLVSSIKELIAMQPYESTKK